MAKSKAAAAVADAPEVPEGHVFAYPTHKRQAGPLVVALPAIDGNSDELVIDDAGAVVPESIAKYLIAGGEITTEKPKADAEAEA